MDQAERTKLIDELDALPGRIEAAATGLNDARLDTPYRDGGWTVRQVVHHVADAHINGFVRTKLTLTEEHPTLKPYAQDPWAALADSTLPVAPSLAILRGVHARWVALLRSLPAAAWARTAHHPERGDMTLDDLLVMYAHHGAVHADQLEGLRSRMGW